MLLNEALVFVAQLGSSQCIYPLIFFVGVDQNTNNID